MLYMCSYTWNAGTTAENVRKVLARPNAAYDSGKVRVLGYYGIVGGGAGYLLVEADEPQSVNEILVPTMGAIAWDVRQVIERDFAEELVQAGHKTD